MARHLALVSRPDPDVERVLQEIEEQTAPRVAAYLSRRQRWAMWARLVRQAARAAGTFRVLGAGARIVRDELRSGAAVVRCLWTRRHVPERQPLGGFRCSVCGLAGADLDDMGFRGGGYVRNRSG